MQIERLFWDRDHGWRMPSPTRRDAALVLCFGEAGALAEDRTYRDLRAAFPDACLLGCSGGGHVAGSDLEDEGLVAVAIRFAATRLRLAVADPDDDPSRDHGHALGAALRAPDLAAVLLLGSRDSARGGELVAGMAETLGATVPIFGGLAGVGRDQPGEPLVLANAAPRPRRFAALGFYGTAFRFGCGIADGWSPFGPRRRVTRVDDDMIWEFDGRPALGLYERYLGPEANGLPYSGLFYPLRVWNPRRPEHTTIRALVGIDRAQGGLRMFDHVPEGWEAQLMRSNGHQLAAAAGGAGERARAGLDGIAGDALAILVSCIGRRAVMGQCTEDELEAAGTALGDMPRLGFYSLGEFCSGAGGGEDGLHNQTIAIAALGETVP